MLDLPSLEAVLEQLLSVERGPIKGQVIFYLAAHGDKRTIKPLKKRLGGFLGKPEKEVGARNQIKRAISKIKERAGQAFSVRENSTFEGS